jgi:hypothetical protein
MEDNRVAIVCTCMYTIDTYMLLLMLYDVFVYLSLLNCAGIVIHTMQLWQPTLD